MVLYNFFIDAIYVADVYNINDVNDQVGGLSLMQISHLNSFAECIL